MKQIKLCLMEEKGIYGRRLADYLSRHEGSPFQVQLCQEHPAAQIIWGKSELVVMAESLLEMYSTLAVEKKVVLLAEGINEEVENCIERFQSAEKIYTQLVKICSEYDDAAYMWLKGSKDDFHLDAIYTPVRNQMTAEAVICLCEKLGKSGKLLYLNREAMSGMSFLFGEEEGQEGLSDLIYYMKQQHKNIGARLEMLVRRREFDYLRPAYVPLELEEITEEEWALLYENIHSETMYDTLIIDFGAGFIDMETLAVCHKVYVLIEGSVWEERLTEQFRLLIDQTTGEELKIEVQVIHIHDEM